MSATVFLITATLLVPSSTGEPLRRDLPPKEALHAQSLEACQRDHAPRIAAARAKAHGVDARRVVAVCEPAVKP
ncbi:MAG: hypothetical protein Q8N17_26295 [Burkholderiaceae bacterium]|nr:hypothetical protein [Burkholderiaceae bacterium]